MTTETLKGAGEVYVSIDIETDGPAPGLNSMLALGAAAFVKGEQWSTFYAKLNPLQGASPNPDTATWWDQNPEAKREVEIDRIPADVAMREFAVWVDELPGKQRDKVAVAWPAAYDFAFVNWYAHRFVGRNPLGFACVDIRSYANGLARQPSYYGLKEEAVNALAGEIDKTGLRDHVAVDDAIGQGRLFVALLAASRAQPVPR
jgi:DNA polymerase III alpha subunit (gram-positive type)